MSRISLTRAGETTFSGSPRLISVLSGKGGVGKSIIALNSATYVASLGYRVLLVDADFQCGNLHILANSNCQDGLRDFVINRTALSDAVTMLAGNVGILASVTGDVPFGTDEVRAAAELISRIRAEATRYQFVIIDHTSGISDSMTVMAQGSDVCLVTMVPEITSISDAYGLYKTLMSANRSLDCRTLINRCRSEEEANMVREKFTSLTSTFLNLAPIGQGWIPEANEIRHSIAVQKSLLATDPESPAAKSFKELAVSLTDGYSHRLDHNQIDKNNKKTAYAAIKD